MPDPATNAPEHILVIDDDRDIREDLRAYLTENGYRVSTAENAPAARRGIHSEEPDLILLDVMMPGEDGISLCRSIVRLTSVRRQVFETSGCLT